MAAADDPLLTLAQFVRGVGPVRAELLARLELNNVTDLLFNLPRDVLDLSHVTQVFDLKAGVLQTVCGIVVDRDGKETSTGKSMVAVLLQTESGFVRGVFFNVPFMLHKFDIGQRILFSGKPKFSQRRWEFSHPQIQWLGEGDVSEGGGVIPRYGLTEGLAQHEMRRLMQGVVEDFAMLVADPLPESFRARAKVIGLPEALRQVHLPQTMDEYQAGLRRILFDDLLEFQLGLALRRRFWNKDRRSR